MLLQLGDKNTNVKYLQYGIHIMCFPSGSFDGVFGNNTLQSVKEFQKKFGLTPDGIVGNNTWNTLKSKISSIQSQLTKKGLNIGIIDGIAGESTYNGVINFQKKFNITPDGQVGERTYSLLFNNSSIPSIAKKVFIDPGHGGTDPGAIGNNLYEKNICLNISKYLSDILKKKGFDVKLSRNTDTFIELNERCVLANNWKANLFISIHCNSFSNTNASGTECYTYPSASSSTKLLSKNISISLSNKLSLLNRGHKEANFTVLKNTNMPALLVETAFISNLSDSNKLKNNQYDFAESLSKSILNYF